MPALHRHVCPAGARSSSAPVKEERAGPLPGESGCTLGCLRQRTGTLGKQSWGGSEMSRGGAVVQQVGQQGREVRALKPDAKAATGQLAAVHVPNQQLQVRFHRALLLLLRQEPHLRVRRVRCVGARPGRAPSKRREASNKSPRQRCVARQRAGPPSNTSSCPRRLALPRAARSRTLSRAPGRDSSGSRGCATCPLPPTTASRLKWERENRRGTGSRQQAFPTAAASKGRYTPVKPAATGEQGGPHAAWAGRSAAATPHPAQPGPAQRKQAGVRTPRSQAR